MNKKHIFSLFCLFQLLSLTLFLKKYNFVYITTSLNILPSLIVIALQTSIHQPSNEVFE